ncbi:MAG: 3-dehydroquinate synthase [Clostridia bacterium]|nr:3-dehydroquinate synthase [Clostridia bacterium]
MNSVRVDASKSYEVLIGSNLLKSTGELVRNVIKPCKAAIITDDIVDSLYANCVQNSLEQSGFDTCKYVFKNGECSKNISTFTSALEFLATNEISRSDVIIALGGGVVGDLAGFCASSYLRGIKFVQIPTTFLAAIDSSVGGKTGINLKAGKNLAGAFWQPSLVICDYSTLDSLPENVFADGIAEAIKYGVISSHKLFSTLLNGECKKNIEQIITQCVTIKRDIVNEDEFDLGTRQLLNFGHTIGHCIEKQSNFKITHGQAVAIGMCVISKAAFKSNLCDYDCSPKIEQALKANGLPTQCDFDAQTLFSVAVSDKKRTGNTINLVIPKEIGKCILFKIDINKLCDFIDLGL